MPGATRAACSHADQTELLGWAGHLAGARPRAILVHGEDEARAALAERLAAKLGWTAELPGPGARIEL